MHPNPALSVLYVLTECIHTEGYLTAFKVDPHTGAMRELGRVTLTGRSSCYISFDKYAHHAIITNYWDGLINVVELSPAGVPLRVVQEHQQTRRDTWRQVESREVRRKCLCWHGCAGMRAQQARLSVLQPSFPQLRSSNQFWAQAASDQHPGSFYRTSSLQGSALRMVPLAVCMHVDFPPCAQHSPAQADAGMRREPHCAGSHTAHVTACTVWVQFDRTLAHLSCAVVLLRQDHMANRQDGPHAHCNVFHPSYNWVFVPDLGDNAIHQYGYKDGRLSHQCHVALPPGEGPRHFVFHPKLPVAYSGCELLSRVQVRTSEQLGFCY